MRRSARQTRAKSQIEGTCLVSPLTEYEAFETSREKKRSRIQLHAWLDFDQPVRGELYIAPYLNGFDGKAARTSPQLPEPISQRGTIPGLRPAAPGSAVKALGRNANAPGVPSRPDRAGALRVLRTIQGVRLMNLAEAHAGLLKVHEALDAAWGIEQGASRRSRLRSIMLKIDREIVAIGDEMLVHEAARYAPLPGNFEKAVKDLRWLRNQADHFGISDTYAARIVSWVASTLPLL